MSRAASAGTRLTGSMTNVADMVRQIVEVMRRLHIERGLTFMIDVPATVEVSCDAEDLFEILSNLIDNASKWASTTVAVIAVATEGLVMIEISDDGPGIPSELRASVFDVGTRLDETKDGGGLGLAISNDLAALYGGSIQLDRSILGGLSAKLKLPPFAPS